MPVTNEQLDNVGVDLDNIALVANGSATEGGDGIVTMREGRDVPTVALSVQKMAAPAYTLFSQLPALTDITAGFYQVLPEDTGTHASVAGDVGATGGQTPNTGFYHGTVGVGYVRLGASQAGRAESAAASAATSAASVAAQANYEQTLGRSLSNIPVAGGTSLGTSVYVMADPLTQNGQAYRIRFATIAAGAIILSLWTKSGDIFTRTRFITITVEAAGVYDFGLSQIPNFTAVAGERLGIYASGVLATTTSTTADSNGWYSGANGTSFTDATTTTNVRLEIGVSFGSISADRYLGQRLTGIDTRLNDASPTATEIVGKSGIPTTGGVNANRTYAFRNPVAAASLLRSVKFWALISGTLYVRKFNKSGDVFTQDGADLILSFTVSSPGVVNIILSQIYKIAAGQYLGFYASNGALVNFTDSESSAVGHYDSGGTTGDVTTFTDAAAATAQTLQLGFTLSNYDTASFLAWELNLLASAGGSSNSDFPGVKPTGYILVPVLGQSNKAGRAPTRSSKTFEAGQAYKYVRSSTSLELLTDPTGNDATAISGSGKGSFGPAFAKAIQNLSNGKLGVIFVNSALGGTTIVPGFGSSSAWAAGGSARSQAITDYNNALAAATTLKLPVVGCCVSYEEGETAGDNAVTGADYKTAWTDFQSWAAGVFGPNVPIIMTRIGTTSNADPAPANYAVIRQAQDEIAEAQPNVYMAHTGTRYFLERGIMIDAFHYNLQGYEEIGEAEANCAFGVALGRRPKGYHG